ncbi:hypothetical protein JX266_005322 [Neoarthrinium moseri]|uniref:uncharacterized protein n=1 Tax=Neoarthrinium moseri TaxID=1658444 RepID=UPI001FDDE727|nr:uncharacterized protein JN550_007400 [Neoarthrinium moseri]KAI1848894.1 hypothetical protein JX266_005322 [Neoarthrinium moseri]KAI1866853.1 hypothetical protein JN550_007400 [Neoarthrinium moseri]
MESPDTESKPSDLPEVVPQNYPIAHAYIRPRIEPGEPAPKYLAYDQTDKEAVDRADIVSPLTPAGLQIPDSPVQRGQQPADDDSVPTEKPRRKICGFAARKFWIVLLLALIVIAAAIGGGVGGGIAASKAQRDRDAQQSNGPASTTPAPTRTSGSPLTSTKTSTTPGTATPTADFNVTKYDFSFQSWEQPNFTGRASDKYDEVGAQMFGFNSTSYIWEPNGTDCCVSFCASTERGGYWCDKKTQRQASGPFNLIIIACGADERLNSSSAKRCDRFNQTSLYDDLYVFPGSANSGRH